MAKVLPGPLASQVRGAVGDTTFRVVNGRQVVQRRSSPTGAPTPAQLQARFRFQGALRMWGLLGLHAEEERAQFAERALARGETVLERWTRNCVGLFQVELEGTEVGVQYRGWEYPSATPGTDLLVDVGNFEVVVEPLNAVRQQVRVIFERNHGQHQVLLLLSSYDRDNDLVFGLSGFDVIAGDQMDLLIDNGNFDYWIVGLVTRSPALPPYGGSFALAVRLETE